MRNLILVLICLLLGGSVMAEQYQSNWGTVFAQSPYKNRPVEKEISCNYKDHIKDERHQYVQYIYTCDTIPKLKQLDFDGAYTSISLIWVDYNSVPISKYINTSYYNQIKWESHSMLSLTKFGRTFFNEMEFNRVYGLTLIPGQTETYMTDFYKNFKKYSKTRQEGYVLDCIVLGEYMLKNGMFEDQRKADLYISHMLYLLRVYDIRPNTLAAHIKNISKVIIKQGSRWTIPQISSYVKLQLKEKYNSRT